MTPRIGLIYIRQSRHKDYERTASPEIQEQACRELPEVAACDSLEVYTDLDVSGGKLKRRSQWLALRNRLEESPRGVPIVLALYDQSRAFRNTADALEMYSLLEQRPWIEVVFVHGRFDRSPAGEFTYTAMAAAHAMERRMTAEKIRAAKAYRSAQGEAVGPLPFGYRYTADAEKALSIEFDEPRAAIIKRIFADYATGWFTTKALAERLNAEGVESPRGNGWAGDTVAQIVANVAYIGKTFSVSRRYRTGELIAAQWPALVDRDTWDSVQRHRARRRTGGRPMGRPRREYVFRNLLVCRCGRRLAAHAVKDHVYYRCRPDVVNPCGSEGIREERLLPWADILFQRLGALQPDEFAETVAGKASPKSNGDSLERVDNAIDKLRKLLLWGHIEDAAYQSEYDRLMALREEMSASPAPPPVQLADIVDAWKAANAAETRRLLGDLFDGLRVDGQEIATYIPRADKAAGVALLIEEATGGLVMAEREGFEPSNRVAPITAFPVPRPRPD